MTIQTSHYTDMQYKLLNSVQVSPNVEDQKKLLRYILLNWNHATLTAIYSLERATYRYLKACRHIYAS